VALAAGCTASPVAIAHIEPRSGSTIVGSAVFLQEGTSFTMNLAIEGAVAGDHGVHLHETGNCSAADAMSAGPHWNPAAAMHGAPTAASHHAGDMGNLVVGDDSRGTLTFTTSDWTLPTTGSATTTVFLSRAIIVHGKADDFTQPAGNAGPRIGCGVIVPSVE